MTLAPISGSFRPGAPTIPQALPGISGSGAAEAAHLQFLSAEERTTAVLMGYFQDARLELEAFIRTGDLTVSDATFYRQLLDETNRIASTVNAQGAEWTSSVIPEGYSAGWRQNSSVVVPQEALRALSGDTLSLITATSDGIRQSVRQAIAQGILQGLPADAVRQRIIATGLTNIPHWPSVEYRAGVIARTETMRAYNAGNLAAIEENGARFAEWIASPDEAVCAICGPRNGDIFRLDAGMDLNDPYPNAQSLPKLPAHPRCRCTIRAVYRGPNGEVIQPGAVEQDPSLPLDAMGGRETPKMPPAAGDLDAAIAKLQGKSILSYTKADLDEASLFWQNVDLRSRPEMYDRLAGLAQADFGNFTSFRYGISIHGYANSTAQHRRWLLEALDEFETIGFRWRENASLRTFSFTKTLRGGASNPAHYIAQEGLVELVPGRYPGYNATFPEINQPYRIGTQPYMKSSMIHEFGHALDDATVGSLGSQAHKLAPFTGIHNRTGSAGGTGAVGGLDRIEREIAATIDNLEASQAIIRRIANDILLDPTSPLPLITRKQLETHTELVQRYEASLEQLRKMRDSFGEAVPDGWITEYAKTNEFEDFADTVVAYLLDPELLKRTAPTRYQYMVDYFGERQP